MNPFWIRIDRDVITVVGSDARSYLQSQLSQDISGLNSGDALASFLLKPTGKVEALVRVACVTDELFTIDTEHGWGEAVMVRLQRFKIRVKVELTVETRSTLAYRDCAGQRIEQSLPAWRSDGTAFDVIDSAAIPIAGIREGSPEEYDQLRIHAGWPLMGRDLTTDMIPGETGIIECAVSFTKGCYPGQELVERMDSRGSTAPRMLRVIYATADTSVGDDVILDGVIVGKYTSIANSIALAVIKRGVDFTRL